MLWLDDLLFEPGSFYVMDRGYMDFARLHLIAQAGAFFVTRAKDNLQYARQRSQPVDMRTGLRSDQIGKAKLPKARADFPSLLRKVRYYDQKEGRDFVFLTNNLTIPALTVATLYRLRWRIELFFRWIKGHLRIKHYYGTSPNAVKTQIIRGADTFFDFVTGGSSGLDYVRNSANIPSRMPKTKVIFFKTETGDAPVLDWLRELPTKARAKCTDKMERLA